MVYGSHEVKMQYAPYSGQEGAKILFDIQTNIIVVVKQRKRLQ